ncbi:MAG TPA: hypothetical protein DHV16_10350 [Nitrospiraceae bacterium]|nr:MAG: hypothetical protein A2Z82_06685 [Nitrospirae bacterium GWA2_46_11]OGW24707.1 MAG: hypothetical protein A2X55_06760 [Nitrospirae bacterium GWB2_47_37]HAK88439.1 hypothetical protein [Nitrospiraceae bacterium]HCL81881.1 hypothetical protein [Nitrospiraceae bacterium]HCZ12625.1 hypothetical protein [Nitrospiraceae bacterium]
MKKVLNIIASLIAVAALTVTAGNAQAADGKNTIQPLCAQCHKAENNVIIGTVVPGSQMNGSSFKVQTGGTVWDVSYDKSTKMKKMRTAKEFPNDEGVKIKIASVKGNQAYAEEMSYKPSYKFKNPDDIISVGEVAELLKNKPTKDGDWVLFDSRGYDNYIEGHLPGAVLLPYYEMAAYMDSLPKDKNTLIVSYCRGGT